MEPALSHISISLAKQVNIWNANRGWRATSHLHLQQQQQQRWHFPLCHPGSCRAVLPGGSGEGCCHTNSTHSSPELLLPVSSLGGFGEALRRGLLVVLGLSTGGRAQSCSGGFTLHLGGAALTLPPPARSGCSCWCMRMAGHRWLIPPARGNGALVQQGEQCLSVCLSPILGPSLLQLLGAVPEASLG